MHISCLVSPKRIRSLKSFGFPKKVSNRNCFLDGSSPKFLESVLSRTPSGPIIAGCSDITVSGFCDEMTFLSACSPSMTVTEVGDIDISAMTNFG